ncbi:targeting protein for Xklp2-B isoform X2 [Pleuronectes platessa]|uniref:targeting protein for Xklp2-B isoform X2 n=1 Tax=Pleuronectes platessa TaxID=8262 RepID=UPI00232A5EA7|nr:targeting protein for Xklp2-B isoform X2 [Pleuronectes platessa]
MAESDCGYDERYEFDAPSHVCDLKELENNDSDDQWFEQQVGGLATPLTPDWSIMRGPGTSTSPPPNVVTSWGAGTATHANGRPKRRTADLYEFHATSHVIDLKELENNDSDDQWFEQQVGGLATPLRPDWSIMRGNTPNLPKAIVISQIKTDVDSGPGTSTSPPPNVVTSWGAGTATHANGRPKRRTADLYEFHATSHVIDLKELENNDSDDQWFEQQVGGLATPLRPDWSIMRGNTPNLPKAIVISQIKTDVDSGPGTSTSPPPNVVTSWGAGTATHANGRPKRRTANQPPAQPSRISKRKVTTTGSAPTQSAAPPSKKSKPSPVARPAPKSSSVLHRNGQRNSRIAPKTGKTELCSSEEQELERIEILQKKVALHLRQNEASYKAALAGNPPPKKVALSTTVPKEFNFTTDNRIKATTSSSTADKEVDFISQLRKPSSPVKAMKGATIPQPFNLSTGNKRKVEGSGAYVPMAQQIEQYQKRTPDRYHLRSRQSQERGPHPVKGDQLKLTQPHTPHLMTRQRSRPTTVKSSAELEAEEVDQLHKFKFKALELNRKLLEGAEHLKKPAVKEPTVPEGFELQIEKRLQERQISKNPEEEERPHTFKSQPLPKRILEGVVGVPERKVLHPTVPESPAFALKKRVRVDRKVEEVKQPSPIKALPVPYFGLPFQPRLPEHHHVEVCPFSFDERERERRAMKEKRLEEKNEEEITRLRQEQVCKAQPIRHYKPVEVKKSDVPLTVPHTPKFSDRFRL